MSHVDRVTAAYRQSVASRPARPATRGKAWGGQPPFWAVDNAWSSSRSDRERIEHSFEGYAAGAGKASGVVFACHYARLRHYAQANFVWRQDTTGTFSPRGQGDLSALERPWPSATAGDLLARLEVDATYAGNSYWTWCDDDGNFGVKAMGSGRRLAWMNPSWVWILMGSKSGDPNALDTKIVAFVYDPPIGMGGQSGREDRMVILTPAEVAHYKPVPDPEARYRGMSWITPVLREIQADKAATTHKLKFFERGAALQTIVSLDKEVTPDEFDAFVERFKATHEGADNAFKTVFVGGGANVAVTSSNLQELDFRNVTGTAQTLIAANAGVHPVLIPLSEGMAGSSLNSGNFKAARRSVADGTLAHLWGQTTASFGHLLKAPPGWRLAVDPDMPFLRDDATDVAQVQQTVAQALKALTDAGYKPDSAVEYLKTNDLSKLVGNHSGLFSVQLQPPGTRQQAPPASGDPSKSVHNGHSTREFPALPIGGQW